MKLYQSYEWFEGCYDKLCRGTAQTLKGLMEIAENDPSQQIDLDSVVDAVYDTIKDTGVSEEKFKSRIMQFVFSSGDPSCCYTELIAAAAKSEEEDDTVESEQSNKVEYICPVCGRKMKPSAMAFSESKNKSYCDRGCCAFDDEFNEVLKIGSTYMKHYMFMGKVKFVPSMNIQMYGASIKTNQGIYNMQLDKDNNYIFASAGKNVGAEALLFKDVNVKEKTFIVADSISLLKELDVMESELRKYTSELKESSESE